MLELFRRSAMLTLPSRVMFAISAGLNIVLSVEFSAMDIASDVHVLCARMWNVISVCWAIGAAAEAFSIPRSRRALQDQVGFVLLFETQNSGFARLVERRDIMRTSIGLSRMSSAILYWFGCSCVLVFFSRAGQMTAIPTSARQSCTENTRKNVQAIISCLFACSSSFLPIS